MSIKLVGNLIDFYGNPAGFLKNGLATVDSNFKTDELTQWLNDKNLETVYKDGVFEKLALNRKYYETEDATPLKNVRVWQLRDGFNAEFRFKSFADMCSLYEEPSQKDYSIVYDSDFYTNDLEEIYHILNHNHPENYNARSLSMSDIIELFDDNGSEFFYVDRFGFKSIKFKNNNI